MAGTVTRHRRYEAQRAVDRLRRLDVAWPKAEWTPEQGCCLWWSFPVSEQPYIGWPTDDAFPDHATHFTPLVIPQERAS
jgi:hypothetical protein